MVPSLNGAHASTANCSVSYHTQPLDHFSYTDNRSFAQRVFTNDQHWRPGGPILFYCGNEASVDLYVNATGWMWERAEAFGALLVWAEHRYYGKTQPFGTASGANASTLRWLTLEQALADYATLIHALKVQLGAPASTKGSIVSHVPSSRLEGSFDGPPPPTLRWRSSRVEARQRRQKLRAGG